MKTSKLFFFKSYPGNVRELKHSVKENFPEFKNWDQINSSYLMDITRKNN